MEGSAQHGQSRDTWQSSRGPQMSDYESCHCMLDNNLCSRCATMYLHMLRPRPTESRSPICPCWAALSHLCPEQCKKWCCRLEYHSSSLPALRLWLCQRARGSADQLTNTPSNRKFATPKVRPIPMELRAPSFQADTAQILP